jgi:hypothetical protein
MLSGQLVDVAVMSTVTAFSAAVSVLRVPSMCATMQHQLTLHFCVLVLQVWQRSAGVYAVKDKYWGRSIQVRYTVLFITAAVVAVRSYQESLWPVQLRSTCGCKQAV